MTELNPRATPVDVPIDVPVDVPIDAIGGPDSIGMAAAVDALPDQMEAALASAAYVGGLPDASAVTNVMVMGMGGSGVAGDIVAALAAPELTVPVAVAKGYDCPAFVGPTTLAIAVSFSGDTEETLEAAIAAHDAGASLVAVTTGGRLAELSRQWDAPLYAVDPSIPMPRAAVGAITVAPLVALERIGLLVGVDAMVDATVAQLCTRRDLGDVESDAVSDAISRIGAGHLLPIFYGGGLLGSVAAGRAKAQVNENVKIPAYASAMPELCHNELAGWDLAGAPDQASPLVVFALRHDYEHPQIARRYDFARRVLGEAHIPVPYLEVRAQGEGPMAQLFDLIFQVDRLSLRMAAAAGRDPGPISLLTDLKAYLAQ
ncbi:SIS domain-containing protein [Candidatus Poriferisodalis sp.]|uniref:SIS domain-containing protein n=1 Tax=Candidatus Poriferisodalis sp. TaxID=3101277 RepID=UPI003D0CB277